MSCDSGTADTTVPDTVEDRIGCEWNSGRKNIVIFGNIHPVHA